MPSPAAFSRACSGSPCQAKAIATRPVWSRSISSMPARIGGGEPLRIDLAGESRSTRSTGTLCTGST